jgi:AbrB family looped-hinge helix DNA binding protein
MRYRTGNETGIKNGIENGKTSAIFVTMTATVTIDEAGRILLPKRLRERLNLRKGAKLKAEIVGGKIQLEEEKGGCGAAGAVGEAEEAAAWEQLLTDVACARAEMPHTMSMETATPRTVELILLFILFVSKHFANTVLLYIRVCTRCKQWLLEKV